MASLLKNILRPRKYALGGVAQLVAWPTYTPTGQPGALVTRDAAGIVTEVALAAGVVPVVIEFEENECSFSDGAKIGTNRFIEPKVMFKTSGRSDATNAVLTAFDLEKTTFAIRLKGGACVLVGEQNGLQSTKSESGAGAKSEDFAGYDLELTGGETARCPSLEKADFEALVALAYGS